MKAKTNDNGKKSLNLSKAVKTAFERGVSKVQEGNINKFYPRVLAQTVRHLTGKFGLDRPTAEDHAVKAVTYALAGRLNGKVGGEFGEGDWLALAINQANNLVKSAFRRRREELSLDVPQECGTDEPDLRGESRRIVDASYADWKNREYDDARAWKAATVYRHLDQLYRKCGVSKRAGEIFSAYVLENQSTEDVARRFNMEYEAVQTSACRTRQRLAKWGPSVVRELFTDAA